MNISPVTKFLRRALPLKYCGAVIVAAGQASRMEGIDKVMQPIHGQPILLRTVRAFQECDAIREIVVVTRPDLLQAVMGLCRDMDKVTAVVAGGKDRPESVRLGMNALSDKVKLAAIQDGARPLITGAVIDRVVRAAHTYGAAAPGVPVKDTVKLVEGGLVATTPARERLQAIQTPQVFDIDLLRGALEKAEKDGISITDDCSAVEHLGMKVRIVEGDERNIKVTTPIDLKVAELFLEELE